MSIAAKKECHAQPARVVITESPETTSPIIPTLNKLWSIFGFIFDTRAQSQLNESINYIKGLIIYNTQSLYKN